MLKKHRRSYIFVEQEVLCFQFFMQNTPVLSLFTFYRAWDVISTDRVKPGQRRIVLPVVRFFHEPHDLFKRKQLPERSAALAVIDLFCLNCRCCCVFNLTFVCAENCRHPYQHTGIQKAVITSTRTAVSNLTCISSTAGCLLRGKPVNNMRFLAFVWGTPFIKILYGIRERRQHFKDLAKGYDIHIVHCFLAIIHTCTIS